MSDLTAYEKWIATLSDEQRSLVQPLMAQLMAVLDSRFNELAGDVARVERRQVTNSERIAELHTRLDHYEAQQWTAAKEAIEQFAAQQLPPEECNRLIEVLYTLVTKVEALEQKAVNDDASNAASG